MPVPRRRPPASRAHPTRLNASGAGPARPVRASVASASAGVGRSRSMASLIVGIGTQSCSEGNATACRRSRAASGRSSCNAGRRTGARPLRARAVASSRRTGRRPSARRRERPASAAARRVAGRRAASAARPARASPRRPPPRRARRPGIVGHHAHRVQRQLVDVLVNPPRRLAVERALGVVALIGDHLADPRHDRPQGLAGAPVVADADRMGGDVGVEDRREHPALRRHPRVTQRQRDLDHVALHHGQVVVGLPQAPDAILELVALRQRTVGLDQLQAGMPVDVVPHLLVVGLEPPQPDRAHRRCDPPASAGCESSIRLPMPRCDGSPGGRRSGLRVCECFGLKIPD